MGWRDMDIETPRHDTRGAESIKYCIVWFTPLWGEGTSSASSRPGGRACACGTR